MPTPGHFFSSPYSFVPFAPVVVLLPEADTHRISHDLPFADGLSGSIQVTLTAKTPLFVGAGDGRQWLKVPSGESSKPDLHVIPGDSLRGCLRAITEVVTLGKANFIEDRYIAVRNLHSPEYTSRLTETIGRVFVPRTRAGWLTAEGDHWSITPCDLARMESEDLEKMAGLPPQALAPWGRAQDRYSVWEGPGTRRSREIEVLTTSDELNFLHGDGKQLRYRKAWNADRSDQAEWDLSNRSSSPKALLKKRRGTLVLTGQPMPRKEQGKPGKSTKHMDFVFLRPLGPDPDPIGVDPSVRSRFLQVHGGETDLRGANRNQRAETATDSWKYWLACLRKGERIPVFYLPDEAGNPRDIGLAFMFRLPSPRSIREALPSHLESGVHAAYLDVAEAIFGRTPEDSRDSAAPLKGRVSFEALVPNAHLKQRTVKVLLQAPRPSFAPAYLQQTNARNSTSWLSSASSLAGRKVYPARKTVAADRGENAGTDASRCEIHPVDVGSVFVGQIHFHNLRPWELGALLWSLNLGGPSDPGERWHRVGAGKPYAFGSVVLKSQLTSCIRVVPKADSKGSPSVTELHTAFRVWMQERWTAAGQKSDWEKCDAVQELIAAHVPVPEDPRLFSYLFLGRGQDNEFQQAVQNNGRPRTPRQVHQAAAGRAR
jgi:CRISPR-associated protein (TIGR03986 family)